MSFKKMWREGLAAILDFFAKPDASKVAFVVKRTVPFSGNLRILADALLVQGRRQLVVYKDGPLTTIEESLRAQGVRVHSGFSLRALYDVFSSESVVLGHSGRDAFLARRKAGRRVINLWHGVAIKRIENLIREEGGSKNRRHRRLMAINSRVYDHMIASSSVDRLTNAVAFGMGFEKVHVTGLPRFDYLAPDYFFPPDLQADIDRLDALLCSRRLVLYAPTFREDGSSVLATLTSEILDRLKGFLRDRNLVFGIRPHPYDQKALASICDGEWIIDLRPDYFVEPAIPLRVASALVVDYSSIWVDYLLLKRPIVGFMPDLEQYSTEERGFIFDFPAIFPGPVLRDWSEVINALGSLVESDFSVPVADNERYWQAENIFLPPEHLRFKSTGACMNLFFYISSDCVHRDC